jgi:hypothetical protein
MITENSLFLISHKSGRYLAPIYGANFSAKYVAEGRGEYGPPPYGGFVWRLTLDPMQACRARNVPALWQLIPEHYWDRDQFAAVPGPVCACCGEVEVVRHDGHLSPYRCAKHLDRNPCAIEGCQRTSAAPKHTDGKAYLANNQAFCGEHWKRYVPPSSRLRTTYHWFFRQAKRHGWGWKGTTGKSARLDWRFRRYWDNLVATARRRSQEGHVDMGEINRLMGWDG